jgi:arsenite-transporting ATPase
MRLILYTGKGGVGKSSIAAATAVRVAETGRRTLLVSSDLAHNLSDIFDTRIGGEPVTVAESLTTLEVDALQEIRDNWQPAQDYVTGFLAYLGMEDAVAEEVALLPGMDDLFLLTRILKEVESDRHDVVIVDCSPTAGTMRLLTFTDTACTKMNRLLNVERQILKLLRPVTNRFQAARVFVPSDEVYGVFDDVIRKVGQLGEILKDPQVSSVRLVLNPDRVAIAETRRAFTYFGLFGFPVDGVFVNKVLPAELADGYLHDWFALQQQLLNQIDQSFLDVAKFRVPLLDSEPIGLDLLSKMAGGVFGERCPEEMLSEPKPVSIDREDGEYRLHFWLPSVKKQDLDVGRKQSELVLTAAGYTRVFSLPDMLVDREIARAEFTDGALIVSFE